MRISIQELFVGFSKKDERPGETIDSAGSGEDKIVVRGLTKVFNAHNPEKVLQMLRSGVSKGDILETTGATVGLYDINFSVKQGELFVLMGLSGSGKSTLERCINRLIEPTSGQILIDGIDVLKMRREELREFRKQKIGMVFQSFALLPHRTVLENVSFGLEVQGEGRMERFAASQKAIELVGLKGYESMYPAQLSGGMKQRVGLARALATDADILLMDEAFSALDPLIRKDMQNELLELQERMRKTIIFVTHDLEEALRLGDRIALMNDGKIIQIGTAEEILTNPADDFVMRFVEGVDRDKVLSCQNVMMKPEQTVTIGQGLRTALMIMKDAGLSTVPVLDKEKKFMGLLNADDALKGIKEGKTKIMEVASTDISTVEPNTSLDELISILIVTNYPIPVLGEGGRLKGMIVPGNVVPFLSSHRGDN
ncbi:MAG: glycine betaine/L-proline ABC transporter ATP-binding protein [Methanomassiliicoccales archaeon]|nr:glycine betaine/L-proline ABC transporter ATP-binding protein [Methanomassiliicoccales archaeon]